MASNLDKFKKLTNNFSTTLSGAIVGAGNTSMSLTSSTNLPTDTGSVYVIDRVNASGTATPTVREYVKGTVSGTNVTNLVRGLGGSTAQAHSTGAVVEQVVDQNTINDLMDGILVQHNQDGTHGAITSTSLSATGVINASAVSSLQDASTALSTIREEYQFDFVASGGVWSGDAYASTLNGSMTAVVAYINGQRLSIGAITAKAFAASSDTYIDILNTAGVGSLVYTATTNNNGSIPLAANSIRLAIVVTGASSIAAATSINQGQETMVLPIASSVPYAVTDSLGNLICPRDPNRKILGERRIRAAFTGASATFAVITGLSVPVIVPTGRKVKVCLYGSVAANSNAGVTSRMAIHTGATINALTTLLPMEGQTLVSGANSGTPVYIDGLYTPTTTSLFFSASYDVGAGTLAFAGGDLPFGFIRVELA